MKYCCMCKDYIKEDLFTTYELSKPGKRSLCRRHRNEKNKIYYENNKSKLNTQAAVRNKKYREDIFKYIWAFLKEHPCVDCGKVNPLFLQFDHIKDKKVANVADLCKYGSLQGIKDEIMKCEVRCIECHFVRTAKVRNYWKYRFWLEDNQSGLEEIDSLQAS